MATLPTPRPKPGRQRPRIASILVDLFHRRHSTTSLNLSTQSLDTEPDSDGDSDPEVYCSPGLEQGGLTHMEQWTSIQLAVVSIFRMRSLSHPEYLQVNHNVRQLIASDLGDFIYDYYKNQLLPKGMKLIRRSVKSCKEGHLKGLENVWDDFYREILSNLCVLLYSIPVREHSVRQLTLLAFRDVVLLQTNVEEVFRDDMEHLEIAAGLEQMLLVLQSVKCEPPTSAVIRLEKMVGRVVKPYLGHLGLYDGSMEPKYTSVNFNIINIRICGDLTSRPMGGRRRSCAVNRMRPEESDCYTSGTLGLETVMEAGQKRKDISHQRLRSPTWAESPPVTVRNTKLPIGRGRKGRRYSCDILLQ